MLHRALGNVPGPKGMVRTKSVPAYDQQTKKLCGECTPDALAALLHEVTCLVVAVLEVDLVATTLAPDAYCRHVEIFRAKEGDDADATGIEPLCTESAVTRGKNDPDEGSVLVGGGRACLRFLVSFTGGIVRKTTVPNHAHRRHRRFSNLMYTTTGELSGGYSQ